MEGRVGGVVNLHLVLNDDWIQLYVSSDMNLVAVIQTITIPGFQRGFCRMST